MMRFASSALILIGLFLLSTTHFGCPEFRCTGDKDCRDRFSSDFVCSKGKCLLKSEVSLPEPTGSEPRPEPPKPDEPQVRDDPPPPDENIEPIKPDKSAPDKTPDQGKPVVRRKLHEPCQDYDHGDPQQQCDTGLICLRLESLKAFCFQDCSQNQSVCRPNKDGRTTCQQVAWDRNSPNDAIRICVEPRQEGETCDPQQSYYCETGGAPPLVCDKGKCVKGKLCTTEGCPCESRPGSPVACDVTQKLICDPDKKQCVKGIPSFEGMPCSLYKGVANLCPKDHVCVCPPSVNCSGLNGSPRTCRKACDPKDPLTSCSHRAGLICKTDGGNSYCRVSDCKTQDDCPFQSHGHECGGTRTPLLRICRPLPPEGPRKLRESCDPGVATKFCEHPYYCALVYRQGSKVGAYCTTQCDPSVADRGNDYCKRLLGEGAACSLTNNLTGLRVCGFSCSATTKCPDGFTCDTARRLCYPN